MTKAGWITIAIVALPIVYAASALQVAPDCAKGPVEVIDSVERPTEN